MKIQKNEYGTKLWLSAQNTFDWAHRVGSSWPCSKLSGKPVFVEFAKNGDLVDLSINGGRGDQECSESELDAIAEDFLGSSHPRASEQAPEVAGR
jgi:hypothetical protein